MRIHNAPMTRLPSALALALLLGGCGQAFTSAPSDAGIDGTSSGPEASPGGDGSGPLEGGSSEGGSSGGGDACVPRTCPGQGFECGPASDGCGKQLDCGGCPNASDVCDVTHKCVCKPFTCGSLGAECGHTPDGCGGTLDCGACEAGTCGGGGALKCGSGTCNAKTCAGVGANCGQISDGCGNVITCPPGCTPPKTCGGGGTANQCGCKPTTCSALGWQCGSGGDGCGGTLNCGGCDGGSCDPTSHSCSCVASQTCQSQNWGCGSFVDSCGATETCGPDPVPAGGAVVCLDPNHSVFYGCCGTAIPGPVFPQLKDASACNGAGPTPPEPGWDCVLSTSSNPGWCCAQ